MSAPLQSSSLGADGSATAEPVSLQSLRHLLAAVGDESQDAFLTKTPDGIITSWNAAAEALYGYTRDEAVGRHISMLAPSDRRAEITGILEKLSRGESIRRHETRCRHKDGRLLHISLTTMPVKDADGNLQAAVTIAHDITSRRRRQDVLARDHVKSQQLARKRGEDLREIQDEVRALLDGAPVLLFTADPFGVITHIAGKDVEALAGPLVECLSQVQSDCPAVADFQKALAGQDARCVLKLETGNVFDVSFSPRQNSDGLIMGVIGVAADITSEHKAEEQRRVLEDLCLEIPEAESLEDALSLVIERICKMVDWTYGEAWLPSRTGEELHASAAYWCAQADMKRLAVFRRAARAMTFPMREVLPGKTLTRGRVELIVDVARSSADSFVRADRAKDAGLKTLVAVPVRAHDEVVVVLAFFLSEESNVDEEVMHWIQGASAQLGLFLLRKQAEAEAREYRLRLRALAAELAEAESEERQRIAKGLHDGVGQTLSLARIKTGRLRKQAPPELHEAINDISGLIEQADEETRSLTFQLSPPVLYELGLEAAVEWLVERLCEEHGLKGRVVRDPAPEPVEESLRSAVFQMVRELLHNIVKHAQARNVLVTIQRANALLRVDVEDDGTGFATHTLEAANRSHGFGLFNVRERAKYFGGRLDVVSRSGQGTKVTVIVPQLTGDRPP